jgi:putative ABC transport system permease protein
MLLVRIAPGTSAEFEETLIERLQAVAPGWSFITRTIEAQREIELRGFLVPLVVAGLVGAFLLLLVVMGLTGVMWQNVTRRTREIGLRRAAGARQTQIHRQIVAEVMVIAGFGVVAGALLAVQIPLLGPFHFVALPVVLASLVVSAVFIFALAGLCGLYPGWSATRVLPAEALRHE